jgi:predicted KAP-like P-loop ATPase
MTPLQAMYNYTADRPQTDPANDRLGYRSFSQQLAKGIQNMATPEGFVVAVYGTWGMGRSTALEFVKYYLEQLPDDQRPIIVDFNPWWFPDAEDLAKYFFVQLDAALSSRLQNIAEQVRRFAVSAGRVVSKVPVAGAGIGATISNVLSAAQDVLALKRRIAEMLREQDRRIVIIIDDMDRLTADEIRQVFLLIKAVADFPNVIYLMAFDKEVVVKALDATQGGGGESYLEKIVQAPFELPMPDEVALRSLLITRLAPTVDETPLELFDQQHWGDVYYNGVRHFIRSPRDVVRLTNTLAITYAAVKGEVNLADFIAIEAIRLFMPTLYNLIRRNPGAFVGVVDFYDDPEELRDFETFHLRWLDDLPEAERSPMLALASVLFPKLNHLAGGRMVSSFERYEVWRKGRRVCSPASFDRYFRLTSWEGDISSHEMLNVPTEHFDAFRARLLELASQQRPDGVSRARLFLDRLHDRAETLPIEHIPNIVRAIYDVGDSLLMAQDALEFIPFDGNEIKFLRIIWLLLRRLGRDARFEILQAAMEEGNALSVMIDEIVLMGAEHGKYIDRRVAAPEDALLDEAHVAALEAVLLEKLRQFAADGRLMAMPHLRPILGLWRALAPDEAVAWVQAAAADDSGLLLLLEKFLWTSSIYTGDGRALRYRLEPRWLDAYFDLPLLASRLRALLEADSETQAISTPARTAAEQIVEAVIPGEGRRRTKQPS